MKSKSVIKFTALISLLISLLFSNMSVALAVTGSWSKFGFTMNGDHSAAWGGGISNSISGSSSTSPTMSHIYVDVRLLDRCKNPDGSWQAWNQFAYNNRSVNNTASTGTISASGNYQNCVYGHAYSNHSLHYFSNPYFSINENHWLYSTGP